VHPTSYLFFSLQKKT